MDWEDVRMRAEISKINFLLQNAYVMLMRNAGISHDEVPRFADDLCRKVAEGKMATYGQEPSEAERAVRSDLLEGRIAEFFAGVQHAMRP